MLCAQTHWQNKQKAHKHTESNRRENKHHWNWTEHWKNDTEYGGKQTRFMDVVKENTKRVGVTEEDVRDRVRWATVADPKESIQQKRTKTRIGLENVLHRLQCKA